MKTKELINKLNNYGFKARLESTSYITYIDIESATGHDVCQLSIKDTSWFDVDLSEYGRNTMAEGDKEFISSVVNDYLATPITERYPEKKYTIRTIADSNDSYLIRTAGGNYFFGCLKMRDSYGDQVSFTKDEIEEMKLDDGLAIDWDKATIEEDK